VNRLGLSAVLTAALLLSGCSVPSLSSKQPKDNLTSGAPNERTDIASELQLDYTILLDSEGGAKRVSEKYRFHGGDRFRIQLRPAFAAHVYILNRGPQQAAYSFLFPSPGIATENPLPANTPITLPGADKWYTLDNRRGVEGLVLIASPVPLVEFNTPEVTIPRDECEERIGLVERDYRPNSSRRFEDKDWTKLFAARGDKTAIVLRLPLDHR
jgi:hypothetical protein